MAVLPEVLPLTRESVQKAHEIVRPHVHLTPVQTNTTISNLASTPQSADALVGTQWEGATPAKPKIKLFFKCENLQRIGAFKVRGAFHAISRLPEEIRRKGIVTHSSGKLFNCDIIISYLECFLLSKVLI
jgi:threonine dehydratase